MSDAFRIDRKGLAEVLGVSRARLDALVREGLPAERRGSKGQPWRFDLRQAVPWYAAYRERVGAGQSADGSERLDPAQERARKDRVERELRELEYRQRSGALLERVDVIDTWSHGFAACRAVIRALPSRLRSRVPGFTAAMRKASQEVIDEALHELANTEPDREDAA